MFHRAGSIAKEETVKAQKAETARAIAVCKIGMHKWLALKSLLQALRQIRLDQAAAVAPDKEGKKQLYQLFQLHHN